MDPERRYADFRVAGRTLTGRALVYGEVSPDFKERFEPGALAPLPSVALNLQHDARMTLLEPGDYVLTDGDTAIEVRAELPEGSAALSLVQRGALTGFSIEFRASAERRDAGVRVIEKATLTGLALVDRGAYPSAVAELRHGRPLPRVWL